MSGHRTAGPTTGSAADRGFPEVMKEGDTVYGSDRGKIGTVKDVVVTGDGVPAYMVVPRGLITDKDTFIPLDAVTHTVQDGVHQRPQTVIGKLPWGERPPPRECGPDAVCPQRRSTGSTATTRAG